MNVIDSSQYIMVKIVGPDGPGITATMSDIVAKGNHEIIDIGQSVINGILSLSLLIAPTAEANGDVVGKHQMPTDVLKELLFSAKARGLDLDFFVHDHHESGIAYPHKFIVSSISAGVIPPQYLSRLTSLLAGHGLNIYRIDNRSHGDRLYALDLSLGVEEEKNWTAIKKDVMDLSHDYQVDAGIVKDNVFRYNKRLIVFDMDSTLIQTEVIDELAELNGAGEKVRAITERAMNGELDFNESLFERVKCLEGLEKEKMMGLAEKLPLTDGVEHFIRVVKSLGYKVAVISGGFSFFANYFRQKLGLDYAFANELEFDGNDRLTGQVVGTIVNREYKASLLEFLSQQESIALDQVVAIGDGANDLSMLAKAGMGIAFHAKPVVKEKASQHMSYGPMTSILRFLGIPEEYIKTFGP